MHLSMIVTLLLKIIIYGIVFMRSRAVNHDRNEWTNQPMYASWSKLPKELKNGIKV